MNYSDLEAFKIQAIAEMESESFDYELAEQPENIQKILWSKGPSYSIVPFELEMSDISPSKLTSKEPSNKKNAQKIYFCSGSVAMIDYFNARGLHHETEKFFNRGSRSFSLKINSHGEKVWLKICEFEDGKTHKAGRVDFDSEFWIYRYKWNGGVITEILSFCSHSVPGVVIYPEYDEKSLLTRLYFLNGDARIDTFNATKG